MSTVVLYCWCHSDSASVLLYFTFGRDLNLYFTVQEVQKVTDQEIYTNNINIAIYIYILFKKVTHNILVYRQVQIIVAVTCVLYISYVIEYKE